MVAWLPIALAAAGGLAAMQREMQYVPEEEYAGPASSILGILGGGLGGYIAGGGLSSLGAASGPQQAVQSADIAGLQRQQGVPRYIPATALDLNSLASPTATGASPLDGALLGGGGGLNSQQNINNLTGLAMLQHQRGRRGYY